MNRGYFVAYLNYACFNAFRTPAGNLFGTERVFLALVTMNAVSDFFFHSITAFTPLFRPSPGLSVFGSNFEVLVLSGCFKQCTSPRDIPLGTVFTNTKGLLCPLRLCSPTRLCSTPA